VGAEAQNGREYITFEVRDSGDGISLKQLDKIFKSDVKDPWRNGIEKLD